MSQRVDAVGLLSELFKFEGSNFQLYTLLDPYDTETLLFIMAKANSEKIKKILSGYFTRLRGTKVQLKGKDLVAMGFEPGHVFKEIFQSLLEARLNNVVETKEAEIKFVEDRFGLNN
jgi:tRNA nucleotidyltransferase (CCA-adding enzyme)